MVIKLLALCYFLVGLVSTAALASPINGQSPYSRDAWDKSLETADFKSFSALLYAAQKEHFPSVANDVATRVVIKKRELPEKQRRTASVAEFQVEAALYLALAIRSGVLQIDKEKIRRAVLGYIGHDRNLESKSLSVLAHLRVPKDISTLLKIANLDSPNRYRSAVYSLRVMCLPEAERQLTLLRERTQDNEKRRLIDESVAMSRICETAP